MPIIATNQFRGISRLNRFRIGDAYAMRTRNLCADLFPALSVRPGLTRLGSAIGGRVLGLGVWQDVELHAVFGDGTWRKWDGSSWSAPLASGLDTQAEWTFTNFKGGLTGVNLIGTNGVDDMQRYDGSTVTTILDAPAGANYISQFADRCWCAVGNELHASAYRDATDWTTSSVPLEDTDSWYTVVETPDGETINGIHAGLTKLTITKPSSIHHLYGYAPSDYEVRVKTYDFGAFNNKSLAQMKGVLHMADPHAISQYEGGVLPYSDFSQAVQAYVDEVNASHRACIGTDGTRLYVSLPIQGADPDTTLVYDTQYGTWNVYTWSALHFALVGRRFYIGDTTGAVHEVTGSSDNGSPIAWEWVTGPLTAPNMAQLLRWVTLWFTAHVPPGSSLQVQLSPTDDGDDSWISLPSLPTGSIARSTPIYLSTVRAAATARCLRLRLSGSGPMALHEWSRDETTNPLR